MKRLKTDDKLKQRDAARVEDIVEFIEPPGNINLVSDSDEAERRVAYPEETLKRLVIELFTTEKDNWKVEEIASRLDQPRQPIKNVLLVLCNFDKIRKVYYLKNSVMAHSWK